MKDLSLHILDILQNSFRAGASMIRTRLSVLENGMLLLEIIDNGSGMDEKQCAQALNPFFTTRTTRKVGLGLSLLKQKAEQAGGSLEISSQPEKGTIIKANFRLDHPDCPPLGDLPGVAWLTLSSNPAVNLIFELIDGTEVNIWDSLEIREAIGDISLTNPVVKRHLSDWFQSDFSTFTTSCVDYKILIDK